jgi:hypothetical protein
MRMVVFFLSVFALVGCSTEPVSPQSAKVVNTPAEFQKKPNATEINIIRDKGFVAGGCAITSYINGQRLAELETGEMVKAYLPAGEVIIGAGFAGKGLCSGAPKKEREFVIKADVPRTLRIFTDQSGNVDILPMTVN